MPSIPATEIAVLTLNPDTAIEDVSTSAGQIFNQMLKTIRSQDGFQRQCWGRQLENPNHLVLVVDWDDVSHHLNWIQSPTYRQFLEGISPLLDLSPGTAASNVIHLNMVPHPATAALSAPVTELAFFALPKSASKAQKSSLEDVVLNLARVCMEGFRGGGQGGGGEGTGSAFSEVRASGFATGWVLEEMDRQVNSGGTAATAAGESEGEGEGEAKGKAITFALMLGWGSKEEHLRAREAAALQEAVRPIREMTLPAEPGRSMYHVQFMRDGVVGQGDLS